MPESFERRQPAENPRSKEIDARLKKAAERSEKVRRAREAINEDNHRRIEWQIARTRESYKHTVRWDAAGRNNEAYTSARVRQETRDSVDANPTVERDPKTIYGSRNNNGLKTPEPQSTVDVGQFRPRPETTPVSFIAPEPTPVPAVEPGPFLPPQPRYAPPEPVPQPQPQPQPQLEPTQQAEPPAAKPFPFRAPPKRAPTWELPDRPVEKPREPLEPYVQSPESELTPTPSPELQPQPKQAPEPAAPPASAPANPSPETAPAPQSQPQAPETPRFSERVRQVEERLAAPRQLLEQYRSARKEANEIFHYSEVSTIEKAAAEAAYSLDIAITQYSLGQTGVESRLDNATTALLDALQKMKDEISKEREARKPMVEEQRKALEEGNAILREAEAVEKDMFYYESKSVSDLKHAVYMLKPTVTKREREDGTIQGRIDKMRGCIPMVRDFLERCAIVLKTGKYRDTIQSYSREKAAAARLGVDPKLPQAMLDAEMALRRACSPPIISDRSSLLTMSTYDAKMTSQRLIADYERAVEAFRDALAAKRSQETFTGRNVSPEMAKKIDEYDLRYIPEKTLVFADYIGYYRIGDRLLESKMSMYNADHTTGIFGDVEHPEQMYLLTEKGDLLPVKEISPATYVTIYQLGDGRLFDARGDELKKQPNGLYEMFYTPTQRKELYGRGMHGEWAQFYANEKGIGWGGGSNYDFTLTSGAYERQISSWRPEVSISHEYQRGAKTWQTDTVDARNIERDTAELAKSLPDWHKACLLLSGDGIQVTNQKTSDIFAEYKEGYELMRTLRANRVLAGTERFQEQYFRACFAAGKREEGLKEVRAFLQRKPNDPYTMRELIAHLGTDPDATPAERAEAITLAKGLVTDVPDTYVPLLATMLEQNGQHDESMRVLFDEDKTEDAKKKEIQALAPELQFFLMRYGLQYRFRNGVVDGKVEITDDAFTRFPEGITKIEGDLRIYSRNFEGLSRDLAEVTGNLDIMHSERLRTLEDAGLKHAGRVSMEHCPNFTKWPRDLRTGEAK